MQFMRGIHERTRIASKDSDTYYPIRMLKTEILTTYIDILYLFVAFYFERNESDILYHSKSKNSVLYCIDNACV